MKILIFSILLLFISCSDRVIDKENSDKNDIELSDNWINEKYLNCLRNNLPCNCLDSIDNILLQFDVNSSDNDNIKFVEKGFNEEELLVKMMDNGVFNIYTSPESTNIFSSFIISGDTLLLRNDGVKINYVRISKFNKNIRGTQIVSKFNIDMLKRLVNSKEFNLEKKLNINDQTQFNCSIELGNLNLLYDKGNCSNKWIVEKQENNILFYRYINSCEGKSYPITVNKKLFYSVPMNLAKQN